MAAIAKVDHVAHLEQLLQSGRTNPKNPSIIEKVFEVAKKTIGISEDNFLPWKDVYFDSNSCPNNIRIKDLGNKPLVWVMTD